MNNTEPSQELDKMIAIMETKNNTIGKKKRLELYSRYVYGIKKIVRDVYDKLKKIT